ncbi:MAG: bifunctional folylpolyglutamate synthase/dihydrofolate synthase [Planctomycetota bacterium]|nr:MAG: bifunctional folylpolyglutamate synthase/dihydrofolate synthase [Planctomycetota bacterium]
MATHPVLADDAAQFLASRINYERAATVPYGKRDFRLDRMRQLLARLGNPHDGLRIAHIAGTKGKGSAAAMLAAVLTAAGYRTGLYSSPHLDRVEERLAIDGVPCPADELAELVAQVRPVVTAMDAESPGPEGESTRPTYFEIVTALALLRFAQQGTQAAVLEVGMGGRLDSTNVCRPLVSVITSISLDHTQQLGSTLAAIAAEKAGIIKPGVPVVSGVQAPEPRDVIAKIAAERGCLLVEFGRDFDSTYHPPQRLDRAAQPALVDFHDRSGNFGLACQGLELSLLGSHQAANAAVALATIAQLRRSGFDIAESAIRQGLASVRWPARVEVLSRRPTMVLDAAHNVASAQALVQVLGESFAARRRVLVFATTRDKDLRGMLEVLLPHFDDVVFTRYWSNPRSVPPEALDAAAAELGSTRRQMCPDPATAWQAASRLVGPDDLLCIAGSFFIAAEMRAAIAQTTSGNHNAATTR